MSAQRAGSDNAQVVVCYQLPSDSDWVLGRLLGDVILSDGLASAASDHFELVELKGQTSRSPPERCDSLSFSRPGGFQPGEYTLTIKRLAASLPQEVDWVTLQRALDDAGTAIVIAPLSEADGLSFGLVTRPLDMSDQEASLIVVGIAEPVVIGPWVIPVILEE